jgi:hypothetical protein
MITVGSWAAFSNDLNFSGITSWLFEMKDAYPVVKASPHTLRIHPDLPLAGASIP